MGASTNKPEQHRKYEVKYALDSADGVKLLLGDYNALTQRRYAGDYAACDILIDLETAIERAGLTDRQREALRLVFVGEYTQVETAQALGVSKQTVNRLIAVAAAKVARVYEAWSRMGEGYALTIEEETA
ncbi:DUF134 domain-containing protein [Bacillus sp. Gen3]|nr:DUF134 domain-containing protein [Bacillus sp. Gen3]